MTVATRVAANSTTTDRAQWGADVDASLEVDRRIAGGFAAHAATSPAMTVVVDAGAILNGTTLNEVASRTLSGFTAPAAGQHVIDRVVLNPLTGETKRIAGTAATGSPSAAAPAIPSGWLPVCRVLISSSDTTITNSMITDERAVPMLPAYEEGTWTPTLTFATPGDLSVAYSTRVGAYTKIGRMVILTFSIQTSTFTHTTASGNLQITGGPFTPANTTGLLPVGALLWQGITKASYTNVVAQVNVNDSTLTLVASGSGQTAMTITATDTPTGGTVILRGTVCFNV